MKKNLLKMLQWRAGVAGRPQVTDRPGSQRRPRIVVLGAGFGGLAAVRALADVPADVFLIDRHNFHTFLPLLYQVATAGLNPADVAYPIRGLVRNESNATFVMGEVSRIDHDRRRAELTDGRAVAFDYLILAAGSSANDFGVPGAADVAHPLYTLADSDRLRNHILCRFEEAEERAGQPDDGTLVFVVVGGGPTGVEMAGAMVELFETVLARDYRAASLDKARVILVEMLDTVLPPFPASLRRYAMRTLQERGVELMLERAVAAVEPDCVRLRSGEEIRCRTVVWAAGMRAADIAGSAGLHQGRSGRIPVGPDLSVPSHPDVFVVGDIALAADAQGEPYPQLAPVAMQQGKHAAEQIARRLRGEAGQPFRYRDRGIMATIGRRSAVARLAGGMRLRGTVGWLAWLFLHLLFLVGFRNRLSVLVNWTWSYLVWERGPRLIFTGAGEVPGGRAARKDH